MAQKRHVYLGGCDGAGRNRYVAFRRAFALGEPSKTAMFHLFADTRYRLIVNGETVCHGPARSCSRTRSMTASTSPVICA